MYYIYEKLRNERKLTDYKVSKDTGIPNSTLSAWKHGDYTPKLDKIMRLANYFDVPVSLFLSGAIGK